MTPWSPGNGDDPEEVGRAGWLAGWLAGHGREAESHTLRERCRLRPSDQCPAATRGAARRADLGGPPVERFPVPWTSRNLVLMTTEKATSCRRRRAAEASPVLTRAVSPIVVTEALYKHAGHRLIVQIGPVIAARSRKLARKAGAPGSDTYGDDWAVRDPAVAQPAAASRRARSWSAGSRATRPPKRRFPPVTRIRQSGRGRSGGSKRGGRKRRTGATTATATAVRDAPPAARSLPLRARARAAEPREPVATDAEALHHPATWTPEALSPGDRRPGTTATLSGPIRQR
ncbi:hypothetical protein J2X68_007855 [Streptomyces sp. 3330]|nr:hypothetical protein [Streptomyces sp. 3330]